MVAAADYIKIINTKIYNFVIGERWLISCIVTEWDGFIFSYEFLRGWYNPRMNQNQIKHNKYKAVRGWIVWIIINKFLILFLNNTVRTISFIFLNYAHYSYGVYCTNVSNINYNYIFYTVQSVFNQYAIPVRTNRYSI